MCSVLVRFSMGSDSSGSARPDKWQLSKVVEVDADQVKVVYDRLGQRQAVWVYVFGLIRNVMPVS